MKSIIEWKMYDGTPETLPQKDLKVLAVLVKSDEVMDTSLRLQTGKRGRNDLIWSSYNSGRHPVSVGDIWAFWPEVPDLDDMRSGQDDEGYVERATRNSPILNKKMLDALSSLRR